MKIFNEAVIVDTGKSRHSVKNDAAARTAEIEIYNSIDGNGGITDEQFASMLKTIPQDHEITLRINSRGGDVKHGLAIYNQIATRRDKVTTIIDGYALSTASWAFLSAKKVIIPENGAMMIHNPMAGVVGGSDDMRQGATILDQHKQLIIAMYVTKTGKSAKEISDAMDAETWFIGKEAKDWGLADEVSTPANIQNNFDLSSFRCVPATLAGRKVENKTPVAEAPSAKKQQDEVMNKEKIIALLKSKGVEVANDATDAQLEAALLAIVNKPTVTVKSDDGLEAIKNELKSIKDARDADKKARITHAVENAIGEGKTTNASKEKWIAICIADESMLVVLNAINPFKAGSMPASVVVVAEDIRDLENQLVKNLAFNANDSSRSIQRANLITKNKARLMEVVNTNTVSSDLKRVVILDTVVRAFAKRLEQLSAFSTVFNNVPLQGTDEVVVPYFPLDTTTSTDFVAANGYDTFGNTNADSKKITINKRKYQGLSFTSSELRRLPYLNVAQSAALKAEALASDIFADVLSVITAANYGAAVVTKLASAFGPDDVSDIRNACNVANWPRLARSLFLDVAYDNALTKDDTIRKILSSGFDTLRTGEIPELLGFGYNWSNYIPSNSENLVGFAAFKSAILFATSPVMPTDEVAKLLGRYDVVTDPSTGIAFEFKAWGDTTLDTTKEVIECSYGYKAGEAAAIKRIVSA